MSKATWAAKALAVLMCNEKGHGWGVRRCERCGVLRAGDRDHQAEALRGTQ